MHFEDMRRFVEDQISERRNNEKISILIERKKQNYKTHKIKRSEMLLHYIPHNAINCSSCQKSITRTVIQIIY